MPAETEAEHGQLAEHPGHHEPSVGDLFWPGLNFAIFLVLAVKYLTGPIREFFRARTQQIRDGLTAGAQAKRDTEALKIQIAKDLADLPSLRTRLAKDLRETAEAQRDHLLEQARAAAARIRQDATVQAEQELVAARVQLRDDVIGKAVREATQLVRGAFTSDDQSRLVREFTEAARAAS